MVKGDDIRAAYVEEARLYYVYRRVARGDVKKGTIVSPLDVARARGDWLAASERLMDLLGGDRLALSLYLNKSAVRSAGRRKR